MALRKIIDELCAKKGISVWKLEHDLGFGNCTIRRWDKSMPRADKLQKVCDYFDVPMDDVLKKLFTD